MKVIIVVFGLLGFSELRASDIKPESIYFGSTLEPASLTEIVRYTPKGSVVMIGEYHDNRAHHSHQVALMKELISQGHQVALGMEFFQTPYQSQVNDFLASALPEEEFLKKINWGSNDFGLYREQVELARQSSGLVRAINAPSALTSRVSKGGIDVLSEEERALLPPAFEKGNDLYFERFSSTMLGHVSLDKILNYFYAQSIWDDTMAYHIAEFKKKNPRVTLVVIVGDFHVRYFGGLPDRLSARTGMQPTVISQMNLEGLNGVEIQSEMNVDPKYGPRAGYIWTAKE